MQIPPKDLARRVVPRWRSITETPTTELENQPKPADSWVADEIKRRVEKWEAEQTSLSAQELLWAFSAAGVDHATKRVLDDIANANDLSDSIRRAAQALLVSPEPDRLELPFKMDTEEILRHRIRRLKRRLSVAPRDSIGHIELARLYSRLGQSERAKKAVMIACGVAPSARFVLRAATRFLVHVEEYELAIKILQRGDHNDPWIQAARISVFDLSGRLPRDLRRARSGLEIDAPPKHLSELAGALATLDYGAGNISRSKKLFKQCAIDPNYNTIAQLQWASQNRIVEFKPELLERSLTFEARAAFANKERRWKDALTHCSDWIQDEPFSLRPVSLGSFIASELLQDYDKSIEFCQAGLLAHPATFVLLNNLAFSYASKGDNRMSVEFLHRAQLEKKTTIDEVIFLATSGMISFRNGDPDAGEKDYMRAIELARAAGAYGLAQQATVHYLGELALLGSFFSMEEIEQISKSMEDNRIMPEVRDIYNARLKPLLVDQGKVSGRGGGIGNIPQLIIG